MCASGDVHSISLKFIHPRYQLSEPESRSNKVYACAVFIPRVSLYLNCVKRLYGKALCNIHVWAELSVSVCLVSLGVYGK